MVKDFATLAGDLIKSPVAAWRVAILSILSLFAFHVAWACGWVPGIPGFAMAADVSELVGKQAQIEQAVVCNAIAAEIKRLRSELRDNETKMIEAQQSNNRALIAQLTRVINEIEDNVRDELEKRSANRCTAI